MPSILAQFQERKRARRASRSKRRTGESITSLAERLRRSKRGRKRRTASRTRSKLRRAASRRKRTATGRFKERARSRKRTRRATRSRRRTTRSRRRGMEGALQLMERKRKRSRSRRRVSARTRSKLSRAAKRRTRRSSGQFREFMLALGERKRARRSSRRTRRPRRSSARRSRLRDFTALSVLSERKRSRRRRRTGSSKRRRSRSRRSLRNIGHAYEARRRSSKRRRRTYRSRTRELSFGLGEARRNRYGRYMPRHGREGRFFGETSPGLGRSPVRSSAISVGRRPNMDTMYRGVLLPALWASGGLIAGRVASEGLTALVAKFAPGSTTLQKWIGPGAAFASSALIWWAGGLGFVPATVKRNRGLIAIGAMMHFVEEIAAIFMPKIISPTSNSALSRALYGDQAGGGVSGLGQCSVGCPTCAGLPTTTQPCINATGMAPNGQQMVYGYGFPAIPGAVGRLDDQASHSLGGGLGGCTVGCPTCAGIPTTQQPCINVVGMSPNSQQMAYGYGPQPQFVPPMMAGPSGQSFPAGPGTIGPPNVNVATRNLAQSNTVGGNRGTVAEIPVSGIAGAAAAGAVRSAGISDPYLAGYAMGNATETERILSAVGMNGLGGQQQ